MKTLKIVLINLILITTISCSDKDEKDDFVSKTTNDACSVVQTESFINKFFPTAKDIKHKDLGQTFDPCQTEFTVDGEIALFITTHVLRAGSESSLETGLSVFKDKVLLSDIGNKAYYIPRINQVSLWKDKDLLHFVFSPPGINPDETMKKEQVIAMVKELLNILYK